MIKKLGIIFTAPRLIGPRWRVRTRRQINIRWLLVYDDAYGTSSATNRFGTSFHQFFDEPSQVLSTISSKCGVYWKTASTKIEVSGVGMDGNKMQNGENEDMQLEIKVEPTVQCYVDDENGFTEFDNSGTIPSTADVGALNLWTSKATSCLITQYKKYRSMVGQSTQIRSLREMFEMISLEMQKFGFYFSPQKCENKWRVLERKYKNLVFRERLKKPGRMRHYGHWEHKRALDEIFSEKKRHMYLEENDFPPSTASNKYTLILPKPNAANVNNTVTTSQASEDPLAGTTVGRQNVRKLDETVESKGQLAALFEKFIARNEKNFIVEQQNKERRHREKMAIRQSELELQKKIFKLKEQEMELKKSQLVAAAQHLHLNM